MELKVKRVYRPCEFGGMAPGTVVTVDQSRLTAEGLVWGILNPSWDTQFEDAKFRPMPKFLVTFEAVA